MNRISNAFRALGATLYGATVYNLADGGLAKTLVLETLRHGTNPTNNLSIRLLGGLPSEGAKRTGSIGSLDSITVKDKNSSDGLKELISNYTKNAKNYFHVFKDSECSVPPPDKSLGKLFACTYLTVQDVITRLLPKHHTFLSSVHQADAHLFDFKHKKSFCFAYGSLGIIISPTLRFRFSHIDPNRLVEDTDYKGVAYKTAQIIEPWRIGPLGSCLTGLNLDWFSRVKNNPSKALTGIAQLVAAGQLVAVGIMLKMGKSRFKGKLPWIIAGALIA